MRSAAAGEHRTGEYVAKRTLGFCPPQPTVPGKGDELRGTAVAPTDR